MSRIKVLFRKSITQEEWNKHVGVLPDATFLYTSLAIDYYMAYSRFIVDDLSFVMLENNKCKGCVPLFLEDVDGVYSFSSGGSYGLLPLIDLGERYKRCEHFIDAAMDIVLEMAALKGVKQVLMRYDPLVNPDSMHKIYNYNVLMKYGFENQSLTTRIIDLRLPSDERWVDLTKGTRECIRKASGLYSTEWYNSNNITREIFGIYQNMHFFRCTYLEKNSAS